MLGKILSGIGSTIFGGITSSISKKQDFNYWKQQQEIQHQYQKQMIDYQNEASKDLTSWNNEENKALKAYYYDNYDSPQAVMQAYQKAGINPNLIAGQVTGSGPANLSTVASSASGGSATSGGIGNSNIDPTMLLGMEYQEQQIEYQKLKNKEQEILNNKLLAEEPYFEMNATNQALAFAKGNNLTDQQIDEIKQRIEESKSNVFLNKIFGEKHSVEIGNLLVQRNFIGASIEEKWKMLEKLDVDMTVGRATAAFLSANEKFLSTLDGLTAEQKNKVIQVVANLETEGDILKLERELTAKELGWKDWKEAQQTIIQPILQTTEILFNARFPQRPLQRGYSRQRFKRPDGSFTEHTIYNY